MSLYNQILGTHPFIKQLLLILGLDFKEYGRLRDVYLKKENEKLVIVVFTRNGGGNRNSFEEVFANLRQHSNYLCDYDDKFDSTYAYIEFSIPEKFLAIAKEIYQITPEERGIKLFMYIMDNINTTNPFAIKTVEVSKEIADKIISAFSAQKTFEKNNNEDKR